MHTWIEAVPLLAAGRHLELADRAYQSAAHVYPPRHQVFRALELTPFSRARVIVLGQDPYHGPGQAHGLAFSVPEEVPPPPSLRNIFREIRQDVYGGEPRAFSPDLGRWARQGVLLLNTCLTVEEGRPLSHARLGWEALTDEIVSRLSQRRRHLVFLLWGAPARAKKALIDTRGHLVLEAAHPSPLAAHRGFFGCGHFSRANAHLLQHRRKPIAW